jgi:hypothetical protein
VNSDRYIETQRGLNAHLCQFILGGGINKKIMFKVLLLHDNSTLHTSFHVPEAITKFGRTVLPIQLTVLTLHYQIIPCLVILKSL